MADREGTTLTVAQWIVRHSFTRVALQFPPELLALAPAELQSLGAALRPTPVRLFLVGDTSFSPCCVDEVAAAHYSAEAIVHYGHTCLTPTRALPAFHALGPLVGSVAAAACGAAILGQAEAAAASGELAVLVWDAELTACLPEVLQAVAQAGGSSSSSSSSSAATPAAPLDDEVLSWASPHPSLFLPSCRRVFWPTSAQPASAAVPHVCGMSLAGLPQPAPPLRLLYLGGCPGQERLLVGSHGGCSGGVWRLDPATGACARSGGAPHARLLASRYRLVGLLKAATSVGIVAGTLAVAGHAQLLAALRQALAASGKAVYVLLVGKVTPAKLANFHGTCDVFVLLACPQASLLGEEEARGHAVPVCTPHEALVALEELAVEAEREAEEQLGGEQLLQGASEQAQQPLSLGWDGELLLSFDTLMHRLQGSVHLQRAAARRAAAEASSAGQPAAGSAGQAPPGEATASTEIVDVGAGRGVLAVGGAQGEAATRLLAREWRGLAYEAPQAEHTIANGRTGRAAGYEGGR